MMSHWSVTSLLWLAIVLTASCCHGHSTNEDCVRIDAAFRDRKDSVYLFHGNEYVKLDKRGTEYRKGSIKTFGGLKGPIDAAISWSGNGKSYFFKGNHYYRYSMLVVGPYRTTAWDKEFEDGIDAAGNRKGKTYFFKGCSVVRLETRKGVRDETLESERIGLPCHVDAAFSRGDSLYVIKGNQVWQWDDRIYGPLPLSHVVSLKSWNICSAEK